MVQRGSGTATQHLGHGTDIFPVMPSWRKDDGDFEELTLFILSGINGVKEEELEELSGNGYHRLVKKMLPQWKIRDSNDYLEALGEISNFFSEFVSEEDFPDDFSEEEFDAFLDRLYTYATYGAYRRGLNARPLEDLVDSFRDKKDKIPGNIDILRFLKCVVFGMENKDWYQDTGKVFRKVLPRFGIKDIELFTKIFAITSARTNFKSHLWTTNRVYRMFQEGRKNFDGENLLPAVANMLTDFRAGTMSFEVEKAPENRRKIVNFGQALLGDPKAVVCDSWLLDAFGMAEYYKWKDRVSPYTPRVHEYDAVEAMVQEMARQSKLEPRQIVSMAWAGARRLMGKHKKYDTETVLRSVFKN